MSYRGRPSKGCESCRNRKVKCDEKKPICTRCSRAKNDCAYRDHADLLFRNQTAVAAQRAEDSWRKRSKTHQAVLGESDGSATTKSPPSDKSSPPISGSQDSHGSQSSRQSSPREAGQGEIPLELDKHASISAHDDLSIARNVTSSLRYQAFERFLYDFVFPESPNRVPGQPTDSLWSFIPVLYQNAPEGSTIVTAVDALAYINFANRCSASQAEALAEDCIAKTVTSLSKAITDKKLAATNETLCSAYLLSVYENFTIQQRRGTITAHQHGATALLHLRPIEQYFDDAVSSRIYEMMFWQQLLANMQIGKRPPPPTNDAISVKESLLGVNSSFNVAVMQMIWKEAMLHSVWYETKRSEKPPATRLELQDLLQSALDLEREFQAWPTTIPPEWKYHTQPNTPATQPHYQFKWQKLMLDSRGSPPEIHTHHNMKKCWIWAFYRTTHLFLLRDLLEMLNWMFRLPELNYMSAATTSLPPGLDSTTLRQHHTFATNHLVQVVEQSCSAMISNFTIPVHTKSLEDVVGMRAYVPMWTLGTLDAVLASGLVPDTQQQQQQQSSRAEPRRVPSTPTPTLTPTPTPSQTQTSSPPLQHTQLAFRGRPSHAEHWTDVVPQTASPAPSTSQTPIFDAKAKKGHIFDGGPRHPYDYSFDFGAGAGGSVAGLDVGARREWLNCMLFYIGSRLGFKKALYVPMTEKYMATVEPIVNSIIDG